MKRILLTVAILAAACVPSFAQSSYGTKKAAAAPAAPASAPPATAMVAKKQSMTATGAVATVTPADPTKGTKSELSVTLDDNSKKTFVIKDTTTIYDTAGKALALKDLTPSAKVKLNYMEKDGVNEAISVHQM